ncbi:CPBP family intramembrane glutamic endopeptidase [Corynebacterium pygosceleis]|uniref:CPBP family intramembrane metalloprotease n=1 Tax=Corynebacterium pygosceleis TaxID=2800406 RepID=A0A9Q4CB35_9CORY|nr:CPBP family intramembrane glutamic endopeptidase [Corynebacterium pygosceleis]MCK7638222.1 CPBP family intramembrane metalloprotease [Corynebacterium pygosceleis]MCK7676256.1 CPBP family intramembrane metalloprotease [Corynebacterium pygosceleis]MCL0121584.1 CPBP family intramembrane metalloprotease [Corynebacterium pygosceleis]MCX7445781.1 CPBP family intramembrane metalloprotease [Corynebacterium pygosceleis]MCX7469378.1 CPBP family intramembrane metalloprotease [Corynebacterium pygoscele
MSGVRSALRLIDAALAPEPLNAQTVTLNAPKADVQWLDLALQLCSASVLTGWGLLVLFLLAGDGIRMSALRAGDWFRGAGLAALIGVPGLVFYLGAVHVGFSRQVVPTTLDAVWWQAPVLLVWSFANAFAEETVVVFWLVTRLRQLGWSTPAVIGASALLRGSYHLYQGFSAGLGNIVMGIVFAWFFTRTRRVWPLIVAHFAIDAVAFVGYSTLVEPLGLAGLFGS